MRVSLCTATGDPGGGDRKLSYSRSTAANVESQMDLIWKNDYFWNPLYIDPHT